MSKLDWRVVSFDPEGNRLTTQRDGYRYEDFELFDGGRSVAISKHFGDHSYESGTIFEVPDGVVNPHEALLRAALDFHNVTCG